MSHATVLVAVAGPPKLIEAQVAEQMEPFCENNAMFADGSRWDWYVIGGRWDGLINKGNRVKVGDLKGKQVPTHHTFLRNKTWHETDRMGWFGGVASTECEISHPGFKGKCLHTDKKTGAKIVSWAGDEHWDEKFNERFIKHLPPDTWLVTVDYHV